MLYQTRHFGFSEYFWKSSGEDYSSPLHMHHSFELITVLKGRMHIIIDKKEYTLEHGESALIFPHQLHALYGTSYQYRICIFSADLVKEYYAKVQNAVPTENRFTLDAGLHSDIERLTEDSSTFFKKGILYTICAVFDENATYISQNKSDKKSIYQMFDYVAHHYQNDCTLATLAAQMGYCYSYLSRHFKQVTGITFNAYVNQYRIRNACYLLKNTNYSILQCAMESGFTSLRSFNRNFISCTGVTPKAYRQK